MLKGCSVCALSPSGLHQQSLGTRLSTAERSDVIWCDVRINLKIGVLINHSTSVFSLKSAIRYFLSAVCNNRHHTCICVEDKKCFKATDPSAGTAVEGLCHGKWSLFSHSTEPVLIRTHISSLILKTLQDSQENESISRSRYSCTLFLHCYCDPAIFHCNYTGSPLMWQKRACVTLRASHDKWLTSSGNEL